MHISFYNLSIVKAVNLNETVHTLESSSRIDYNNICSFGTDGNKGIVSAIKITGYIIVIMKWVIPMLLIGFGMVDFFKAILGDEKSLNKAAGSFAKRVIAGIVVFLLPTLISAVVNIFDETRNSLSDDSNKSNFAACTKCLFDPFNSCQ